VGKTTIVKTVAQALGDRAGGFYTEEIRGPGGRQGFRLVTLEGLSAVMAHVNLRAPGRPRVSRYGVDVDTIERVGVAALRTAMRKRRIVVVDEIGKMELFCAPFKEAISEAMGGPCHIVATAMARPNAWVDALKALPNVTLWTVTVHNRDGLAERALRWVGGSPSIGAGGSPATR
jgi:nucleoside-triphosphatase